MKLIIQVLAYQEIDFIQRAIEPWIKYAEHIDIFEGAFHTLRNLGYAGNSDDGTLETCVQMSHNDKNVKVHFHDEINEPVLRNRHFWQVCRDFGREDTFLFILDADEVYTDEEIQKCLAQVEAEKDQFNTWWVNMKNYINDEKTYYLGFRVPRFFKLKDARGFSGYNDICFDGGIKATDIHGVLPRHYSWCPVTKAARKISWQRNIGWMCSFDVQGDKVVLNDEYYRQTGKQKPVLLLDT